MMSVYRHFRKRLLALASLALVVIFAGFCVGTAYAQVPSASPKTSSGYQVAHKAASAAAHRTQVSRPRRGRDSSHSHPFVVILSNLPLSRFALMTGYPTGGPAQYETHDHDCALRPPCSHALSV